jgi:creatine kinase/arginine kinase
MSTTAATATKVSLLDRLLTPELYDGLKALRTPSGFTIDDVIRSGRQNPDSSVGVYAGDEESYSIFAPFLDQVIAAYHKFDTVNGRHLTDFDPSKIPAKPVDPSGTAVISTRIRVGRNLKGFPLAPAISREQRNEVMRRIVEALQTLSGDLRGDFFEIDGMDEAVRARLVADHFLFKQGDRFLASAGANRDWPEGRGIFHNADKTALVWVNEEDQLRIIAMEKGGGVRSVFERLSRLVGALEARLPFAYHEKYGAVSSCPTNLGTAMRASVHVRLPNLGMRQDLFKEVCSECRLSIRGIHGEHSESSDGVYDISNTQRLGLSEVEAVSLMYQGVKRLIEEDRLLA